MLSFIQVGCGILLAGIVTTLCVAGGFGGPPDTPRAELWKQVEEANAKGLPQTAIKALEPIIQSALADKAYPEAIRAIAQKIALEGTIQGNKPEERIVRLEAEIAKAPAEMKPVMAAILADWYWHYFQQNRWRFAQRSATVAAPSNDITTWDLPRIMAEISKQFDNSLAFEKELKAIPIAAYSALLESGTVPDNYRPTLYDFVVFEALEFYSQGEQAAAAPIDAFEIDASSPIFGSLDDFLAWNPQTGDERSPKYRAVKLYQAVLSFHKNDQDASALLDADLHRLTFGNNTAYGEEKAARYRAALRAYIERSLNHELSSLARHRLARAVWSDGDAVAAREIALQGKNAFPASNGGKLCANLVAEIEARSLSITTERVWNAPWPVISLEYRNLNKVWLRAYRVEWTSQMKASRWHPESLPDQERQQLLARKPDRQWTFDLPPTPDFQPKHQDLPPPQDLDPGFYFLFASANEAFTPEDNVISMAPIWVSDLALVIRQEWGAGRLEGFVLKAGSGEPVAGAKVRSWSRNPRADGFVEGPTAETDANGLFAISGNARGCLLLASHGGQALASQQEYYLNVDRPRAEAPKPQTILFTDRSLYRPGQTIHFKGICLLANQQNNDYKVLPNRDVTVIFRDANDKEITKATFRTNDFGSFSGHFTAPRDRLSGSMTLLVPNEGLASIRVEEYKRPKFQVSLDKPKEGVKLGGSLKISGRAMSYTGAAVGGAKVRYRVVREVRWPIWFFDYFWWRLPPNRGESQEIAFGSTTTEQDGSFSIEFITKPDRSVPESDDPRFDFSITADVTDTTGETRSHEISVTVGYSALQAEVACDPWQTNTKPVKLNLKTSTLDGESIAAKGTLKVYRLKSPPTVQRPALTSQPMPRPQRIRGKIVQQPPKPDPANPRTWELGELVSTHEIATDAAGKQELPVALQPGLYRAILETADAFGKPVKAQCEIRVLDPESPRLDLKIPHVFDAPRWKLEPGEELTALWGTGYERGRAFVEIQHRGRVVQSFWTDPQRTQVVIRLAVDESYRGGFHVHVTYVRENRVYLETRKVDVPWTNKELTVKWERFVSKLEPSKRETFTAVVQGPNASRVVAEMTAAMYDASLDAYLPHHWLERFNVFHQEYSRRSYSFENMAMMFHQVEGGWKVSQEPVEIRYRSYPPEISRNLWGFEYMQRGMRGGLGMPPGAPQAAGMPAEAGMNAAAETGRRQLQAMATATPERKSSADTGQSDARQPEPRFDTVATRSNLNELAFFFPHLTTDDQGTVRLEFTMPETLTTWKFLGFAHAKELSSGSLRGEVITAKDLMVQPNPPRFLREGDRIDLSVKVSNQSPTRQQGQVALMLADARTLRPLNAELGLTTDELVFDLAASESKSFFWTIQVPDGLGPIVYKAVGTTGRLSDGEEGMLPVLSRRVLVTESLPLPIRGSGEKSFEFLKLNDSAASDTLQHQALTIQMTSQPAWYAVMALPYLMEYPHEGSEQVFNRYYANALARHIAKSDPEIRRVFDLWKNTPALESPLHKNQDLKAVMIEETPWLREADEESQARRNVGLLFDDNRLQEEAARSLNKLTQMQKDSGAWPWFPGGPDNQYLTLYIITGFGRLRRLGAEVDLAPALKSLDRLDAWMQEQHRQILKEAKQPEDNHLTPMIALYLYGRSFFLRDKPIARDHQAALDYWMRQGSKYWLQLNNRKSQAHLAIGLKRFGDQNTPREILASLRERSVSSEELGMFWRETELGYTWYRAPIETQAMMIEAFDEIANDRQSVEDCKVWLLKQKQTQCWRTTKATADAVYALLLRGDKLLTSTAIVEVKVGDQVVQPKNVEAGTGFYEHKWLRNEIKPDMGKITLTKKDAGVSWGSVHWQYLEDISKVTSHESTPLKLEKSLYRRTLTRTGPVIEKVRGPVAVGDELLVRIVLCSDRDLEFCHLKDHRGSGTEPVNVLSQYKFQDGLFYYESTKDTASHFFIDYLPKGVYVFEYPLRVQHRGRYPMGLAQIECMYAPEFNSHSASMMLEVP